MDEIPPWADSLPAIVLLFTAAAVVVVVCGVRLTSLADRFADRTGLGEAVTGAVFLGALTSLPGSVASVVAAAKGEADLALANGIGGIAAQTLFLVVADAVYRRANLEHAAASLPNMITGTLLIILLSLLLVVEPLSPVTVYAIHPVTPLLFLIYALGVRIASQAGKDPMWAPQVTRETREDRPDEPVRDGRANSATLIVLLGLSGLVGVAGYVIGILGLEIADRAAVRQGIVGALLTSVATSTPELVTTVAAVRRGALTLAVSGVLGGNAFDVLFAAFSDIAYRPGSIYHAVGADFTFLVLINIIMTAILLLGLLRRERHGPANIGFEGVLLGLVYICGLGAYVWAF